ncbi:NAD(P)/FAD-dependent oxidoreductase [Mucilaginibacter arboris]|uniref:NADH:ubiquinone reductase (non-electrogenic) n=1 Tax=Mucilaginibacter arboris TaxID=2682090 RepID=A0A7K1SX60_9SPHI|nr:NAD(P)/FAD-dependent oxidoreductase [Mucilaginibacter arboris]MVN21904.1 NAD(P)/FAD-dependent oxidoreductase [Mucilaginibacter arboris]
MRLNEFTKHPKIVIIGGGFGGIQLAKTLKHLDGEVLLIDRHNYHTFQPLLYQVATGSIQAESISFPLRKIFHNQDNLTVIYANVKSIDSANNTIITSDGNVCYDYLVLATGSNTNFFGNQQIEHYTMPMKNVTEALNLRSLMLQNLEAAFLEEDPDKKQALLNFVIVGGGPTGVELSGSLAEFRNHVLAKDFPEHKKETMKVYLIEGKTELLAAMSEEASVHAKKNLTELGVEISNDVHVKSYDGELLTIDDGRTIRTKNVIWAAGVKGELPEGFSPGAVTKGNRVQVDTTNRVHGYENIFAIGDAAAMITLDTPQGHPGVAPVAMQQGKHLGENLIRIIKGEPTKPFVYNDKGSLATIGRNKAVADLGKIHLHGFIAWLIWIFVHLMSLVGFTNRLIVFLSWASSYLTYNGGNRLIIRRFNTKEMKLEVDSD